MQEKENLEDSALEKEQYRTAQPGKVSLLQRKKKYIRFTLDHNVIAEWDLRELNKGSVIFFSVAN